MGPLVQWIVDGISSLLFPPCCGICDGPVDSPQEVICESCRQSITFVSSPFCETCGLPLSVGLEQHVLWCGRCMTKPPFFWKARYGLLHKGDFRRALIQFKYYGLLHHGRGLSFLLNQAFEKYFIRDDVELIIPMPMHTSRLRKRGFNQVVFLGDKLSRHTGIPMRRNALVKVRDTLPQVGLSRAQRMTNVRGSFGVAEPGKLRGRRLLLLDDVSTTGSTIAEAARTLKKAGADAVSVLVLALRTTGGGAPE